METGYAQGNVLYKAGRTLVEKKKDIPSAMAILHRIVRVYPRSFFASYSRRVINHHEAHNPPPERASERGVEPPTGPFFFPPSGEL